jgi:RimJ/RimL family protein N-acetyltransferase
MKIRTARLLLREYVEQDAQAFLAYQSDPRAREFHDPDRTPPARLQALVPLFMQWAQEVPRLNWQLAIVTRKAPDTLIGSVGLRRSGALQGVAEFGLELAPSCWGRGYATEAAEAALAFGFSTLHLTAVRAITVSANARVTRLVERLGFRRVAEEVGSAWLAARGWREVTWELRNEEWRRGGEVATSIIGGPSTTGR